MSEVIDPRHESIYAGVREDATRPLSDARRFRVGVRPHVFEPVQRRLGIEPGTCGWCGSPRLGRVHPLEVA